MEKLDGILRGGKEKRGKEEKSVRSNGTYIIIARYSVRKEFRGLISTTIKFSIRTGTYAYIIFVLFERR